MKKFEGFEKGVNLGGWFSQCSHTKERYDSFITEADFKRLSDWGIDHVRLPIDYNLVENDDGSYCEEGFLRIDRAIQWCKLYGLHIVLDLHKTHGFSFDFGEKEAGFFENETLQERFFCLWETFAQRYAQYADILAFELLNEVTDASYSATWNRVAAECVKRIRAVSENAKRVWIIIGGYHNNNIDALEDLLLPPDERIVYTFHCYEPLLFTHQGAYWIPTMPRDFRIAFPGNTAEYKAKAEEFKLHTSPIEKEFKNSVIDAALFTSLFAKAVSIAESRGVPLYCGEYGVINLASANDTVLWYKAIHSAFKNYGIAHCAWSYKEMDFGLSDAHLAPVFSEIKALL